MGAANENEIIVSDFTVANCGKEFKLEQLEPIMVKGKKDPVSICKLVGASNDIINITDTESSNIFGRNNELTYLRDLAEKIKKKNTDSLLLLGEAGVGKTFLVNEFLRSSNDYKCMRTICRSYDSNSAYSCFRNILLSLVGLEHSSENNEIINKLNMMVDEFIPGFNMFTPLLLELVGVSPEENSEVNSLDAKTKREKRLETITNLISSVSTNTPVLIHIDNLQWVDSSSCEIFVSLLNNKKSNIFILSTARNKSEIKSYANKLTENIFVINNLDKDDAMQMLTTMSARSDEQYLESMYLKTQGNPLFIMEMAKSNELEAGNLPDTIYDIVMNKVDRLSPENKFFLQEASVVGQEFSVEEIIPVVEQL